MSAEDFRYSIMSSGHLSTGQPWIHNIAPWTLHTLFFAAYTFAYWALYLSQQWHNCSTTSVYSPASPVLQRQLITFDPGFGDNITSEREAIFNGRTNQSPESNAEWRKYQLSTLIHITDEEASKLKIPTAKHNGKPVVLLDLFHQLHCLNNLRMELDPDHYTAKARQDVVKIHRHHCIESIKQSLMCSGDVTPISVEGAMPPYEPVFGAEHNCINFERLDEWVHERVVPGLMPD